MSTLLVGGLICGKGHKISRGIPFQFVFLYNPRSNNLLASLALSGDRCVRPRAIQEALYPEGAIMKHYEIVFMVHPDQSEQVQGMIDRYKVNIETKGGKIHRLEDWGRRQLAYPINKLHKAHYVLMNVECGLDTLSELKNAFRFNDAVIRHMILNVDEAITEPSALLKERDDRKEGRGGFRGGRDRGFAGDEEEVFGTEEDQMAS